MRRKTKAWIFLAVGMAMIAFCVFAFAVQGQQQGTIHPPGYEPPWWEPYAGVLLLICILGGVPATLTGLLLLTLRAKGDTGQTTSSAARPRRHGAGYALVGVGLACVLLAVTLQEMAKAAGVMFFTGLAAVGLGAWLVARGEPNLSKIERPAGVDVRGSALAIVIGCATLVFAAAIGAALAPLGTLDSVAAVMGILILTGILTTAGGLVALAIAAIRARRRRLAAASPAQAAP